MRSKHPESKKGYKAIPAEVRRHLILTEIAKGTTYTNICNKFAEEWSMTPTSIGAYVREVINHIREEETKETLIAINQERLDSIISDAMKKKDTQGAVKAIDTQNKMLGAYTEKVKIDTNSDVVINFDFGSAENN